MFTLPFIAGIAVIMIFTYAAEGILLNDTMSIGSVEQNEKYENIRSFSEGSDEQIGTAFSFNQYLNINYAEAKILYDLHGPMSGFVIIPSYDLDEGKSALMIAVMWHEYDPMAMNGEVWYQIHKNDVYLGNTMEETCGQLYDEYVAAMNWTPLAGVDTLLNFLGSIPSYFGMAVDLLTFNIKGPEGTNVIPAPVQFIILVFMIPLWIILIIGILPYIIRIVEAIGAVLPDWL